MSYLLSPFAWGKHILRQTLHVHHDLIRALDAYVGVVCHLHRHRNRVYAGLRDAGQVHRDPQILPGDAGHFAIQTPQQNIQALRHRHSRKARRHVFAVKGRHANAALRDPRDHDGHGDGSHILRQGSPLRRGDAVGQALGGLEILKVQGVQHNGVDGVQHVLFAHQGHLVRGHGVLHRIHGGPGGGNEVDDQAHRLGCFHRQGGLHGLHLGANGRVIDLDVVVVVQLPLQGLHHGAIRPGDIQRHLGIGDVQQVVPLTPQIQLRRVQGQLPGGEAGGGAAHDVAVDGDGLAVHLPHGNGNAVGAGVIHGNFAALDVVLIIHLIRQCLLSGLLDGAGVRHNADLALVQLEQLAAGPLEHQVDGGVIARQQHQILVRQGSILAGELHRNVVDLHGHLHGKPPVHIDP